jgi:hypothetical protein
MPCRWISPEGRLYGDRSYMTFLNVSEIESALIGLNNAYPG